MKWKFLKKWRSSHSENSCCVIIKNSSWWIIFENCDRFHRKTGVICQRTLQSAFDPCNYAQMCQRRHFYTAKGKFIISLWFHCPKKTWHFSLEIWNNNFFLSFNCFGASLRQEIKIKNFDIFALNKLFASPRSWEIKKAK